MHGRSLALVLLLSAPTSAQIPSWGRPDSPGSVAFDDVGDGAIWIRGRNYKARVDARGLTYIPFLGSSAPRDFPVTFALRSASIGGVELAVDSGSPPIRDGQRIWIEHGAITELLDVSLDSIEQSFVVHRGARTGALDVQLDVDTELSRAVDAAGTWFRNEHGAVSCGHARTLDARGREIGTSSRPSGRSIEFDVDASEVARAEGELTIDPIIATVAVDSSDNDDRSPDVAYDVSNDRYIVVFERIYSQTDHDIFCQMLDGATGQLIPNTWSYIDFTWEDWRQPSVANMNNIDQFMVVASVGPDPRVIKCRTRAAGSTSMGTPFALSHAAAGGPCDDRPYNHFNDVAPVVGGDTWPGSGSNFCCVAWVRNMVFNSATDICPDVVFCTVSQSGQAAPTQFLEHVMENFRGNQALMDGTFAMLSISKSDGDSNSGGSQDWNLAWQYWDSSNIHGAQVHWTGTLTHPVTSLVSGLYLSPPPLTVNWRVYQNVSVSSPQSNTSREFMLTFDVPGPSGTPRLIGALVNPWGTVPESRLYDLTAIQGGGSPGYTQWHPVVDCDGTYYVVAFNGYPGGYQGLAAAQFGMRWSRFTGWSFGCLEPQIQIAQDPNAEMGAHICAEPSGGGSRRNMLIGSQHWRGWSQGGGVGGDPFVALHAD